MNGSAREVRQAKRVLRLFEAGETISGRKDNRFERVFRCAPVGLGLVDRSKRLLAANPALCRMLERSEGELAALEFESLYAPDDRLAGAVGPLAERDENERVLTSSERRLVRGDGTTVWADVTLLALPDSSGDDVMGVMMVSDLTVLKETDDRLREAETALMTERSMLESKNTALREVLEQIESHKRQSARQLQANVNRVIRPMLQILADKLPSQEQHLIGLLDSALKDLLDPFVGRLENLATSLTRRETEVCHMIRNGFSSKQIASVLHTSICTVHNQRRSIRKKLRIDDGITNLESFLKSF